MVCKNCGETVRGVASPTGICRKCRGLEPVKDSRKNKKDKAVEPEATPVE